MSRSGSVSTRGQSEVASRPEWKATSCSQAGWVLGAPHIAVPPPPRGAILLIEARAATSISGNARTRSLLSLHIGEEARYSEHNDTAFVVRAGPSTTPAAVARQRTRP